MRIRPRVLPRLGQEHNRAGRKALKRAQRPEPLHMCDLFRGPVA